MSLSFDPDKIRADAPHFIDGRRVADGDGAEIEVRRPSDLRVVTSIKAAGEETVDRAARSAVAALGESRWAGRNPRDRAAVLIRFADLVVRNVEELARLEAWSSTRLIAETVPRDVVRTAEIIRYYGEQADKIEGVLTTTAADATCMIVHEPYGVVGAIIPWNFPLINAAMKVAPALVAGNAVLLKPSELTPFSAVRLAELAVEAGLPAGLFNVLQGGGATGSAIVRHPAVGKVSFTGSTATGRRILEDAAAGTKPATLELGGKSPIVVLPDVRDRARLAGLIANAFTYNGGQVCTAGTRLIVHRAQADELIDRVAAIVATRRPGPTWDDTSSLSPIVSERQAARAESLLKGTVAAGATIRLGGRRHAGANAGIFLEPTVLEGVGPSSPGFLEEFFAPILAVYRYDDEEEAIALAYHPLYALAASLHTDDAAKAMALPRRIEAGFVWVNAHGRAPESTAPQGGFRGSGYGKDMGRAGLEAYLRQKTVWHSHSM